MSFFDLFRTHKEPRSSELANRLDDLESRIEYVASELKKVRGRQYALERNSRGQDEAEEGDGSRADESTTPTSPGYPARAVPSTAHLARRFRGF